MSAELKLAKAAELEQLAAKLRAEVEAETPKKWEPRPSSYFIDCDGDVIGHDYNSVGSHVVDFGTGRSTHKQATKDAKRMRKFNRLLCWLVEHGWDGELDVYAEISHGSDIVISFTDSGEFVRELTYGIANGVIEL